jgi:glycosyltransferase involved in cell wall biosynthesis
VIASRAGAIPEIMTRILPEWLFEPGDAEGLAIALRRFLSLDSGMDGARLEQFVEHAYGLPVIWPAYERLFGLQ